MVGTASVQADKQRWPVLRRHCKRNPQKTLLFNDSRRLRRRGKHTLYKPLPRRMVWGRHLPDRHLAGIHCRVPEAIRSLSALLPHQRRLFSGWNQSGGHTLSALAPYTISVPGNKRHQPRESRNRADCTRDIRTACRGIRNRSRKWKDAGISIPLCHGRRRLLPLPGDTGLVSLPMLLQHRKCRPMPGRSWTVAGWWKDYSRNGRDPHICHTHLTDVQRPPQPAVADLTGMAGSHRKSPSRTSALGQGEGTGKQLLSAGERRRWISVRQRFVQWGRRRIQDNQEVLEPFGHP